MAQTSQKPTQKLPPFIQFWHGKYRVRRPIPAHLRTIINRGQCLTESLGTADLDEAIKRSWGVLQRFQAILDKAAAEFAENANPEMRHARLADEVIRRYPEPTRDMDAWLLENVGEEDRLTIQKITHRYYAERAADSQQRFMMQFRALNEGIDDSTPPQRSPREVLTPEELIRLWKQERQPGERAVYEFTLALDRLLAFLKTRHLEGITPGNIVKWKEHLLEGGADIKTVKNAIVPISTLFRFAVQNHKLANNPAEGIIVGSNRNKAERHSRLPFDQADARLILNEARKSDDPVIKWANFISAYSGARLEEIVGAAAADIRQIEGV